ncbi:MAG: hypothetical protein M3P53_10790, partial [Actinomycetota bacterium]|nr:hypothetical protein [Actinomycetota bacterium]
MALVVTTGVAVPPDVEVLAVPVAKGADGPELLGDGHGLDPGELAERRFEGKVGETLDTAGSDRTTVMAVGVGDAAEVSLDVLRRSAAALVRAAWKRGSAATTLLDA